MTVSTNRVNLETDRYVRVNVGQGKFKVQALGGTVYMTITKNFPAVTNRVYHLLYSDDIHTFDAHDGIVWMLAKQKGTQCIITEWSEVPSPGNGFGAGDLTVDAWGTPKVSMPMSIFHGMWTYDIPPSMWLMYENGSEVTTSTNITSTDGVAKLLTDGTNTTLLLESKECPRYQPNRGHLFSMAGWFPNKKSDGVRDFGLFTTENGVFFRLKSNGKLYAVLRRGSTEVKEEEIDTSGLTNFDVTKNNIYDIQFQWRAAGNYHFYIGDPGTGTQKLVHKFDFLGTLTSASIENPALPVAFKATRTTENVEMHMGCADITSENGTINNTEQYGSAYAEAVSVNGTDDPVIVIRNPSQVNSETNTRTCTLARITFICNKKATFKVWKTRDFTAIAGAVFKDVDGSVIQCDSTDMDATATRSTGYTTSSMQFVRSVHVEATTYTPVDNPFRNRIEFPLVRGDYLAVSCTASSALADVDIEWGEQI